MFLANHRYGLVDAPGALAGIQDFLNTASAGRTVRGHDYLDRTDDASEWAEHFAEASGLALPDAASLAENDLEPLRQLRAHFTMSLSNGPEIRETGVRLLKSVGRAELELGADGVELRPTGKGWRQVYSALLVLFYNAQLSSEVRRLKVCPNEWCHVAFYDRSKNRSAIWHDPSSCGNVANVRASRARKLNLERLSAN